MIRVWNFFLASYFQIEFVSLSSFLLLFTAVKNATVLWSPFLFPSKVTARFS